MTNLSRLALVAAVAAVGLASPAFAQSFDPEYGTGNTLPFSYVQTASQSANVAVHPTRREKIAARRSGVNAFAMVPGAAGGSAYDPASTGGGSIGYNENLRKEQW